MGSLSATQRVDESACPKDLFFKNNNKLRSLNLPGDRPPWRTLPSKAGIDWKIDQFFQATFEEKVLKTPTGGVAHVGLV